MKLYYRVSQSCQDFGRNETRRPGIPRWIVDGIKNGYINQIEADAAKRSAWGSGAVCIETEDGEWKWVSSNWDSSD